MLGADWTAVTDDERSVGGVNFVRFVTPDRTPGNFKSEESGGPRQR